MGHIENQKILQKVDEIIDCIQTDPTYQRYLELKKALEQDEVLLNNITEIKKIEKELVRAEQKGSKEEIVRLQQAFDRRTESLEANILYSEFLDCQSQIDETLKNVQFLIENFLEKKINF